MPKKNKHKPFNELVKQIEAYGLKDKLADLVHKEQARRPFRHLPKQFSKGILIGNIAIVPKKHTDHHIKTTSDKNMSNSFSSYSSSK